MEKLKELLKWLEKRKYFPPGGQDGKTQLIDEGRKRAYIEVIEQVKSLIQEPEDSKGAE